MDILKGTGVALITPFHDDLSVDFEGLRALIDYVSPHVDYLVVHGTTAEAATTNTEEKKEIFEFVKAHNSAGLPLVYGIGGNNTAAVLDTIRSTDLTGVSAILSVSPYYNKPSQEGIYQHYRKIADAAPLPVILYNVPGRTGSNISVATTLRLAQHPNIIGTKDASGDLNQHMRITREKPEDFLLISGDDMLTLAMMAVGSVGAISVIANGLPDIMGSVTTHALAGNFKAANAANSRMLELNPLLYEESNPVGVKEVLKQKGVCGNQVRLPLVAASESLAGRIKEALEKL